MADVVPDERHAHFGSIRLRVFLLYAFILLVTFSAFSVTIYTYFRHEAYQKVDALLDVRAAGLANAVKTYLATRKAEAPSGWAAFFSGYQDKGEQHFSPIADFLTETDQLTSERRLQMAAQIFDPGGNPIAESGAVRGPQTPDPAIPVDIAKGEKIIRNFKWVNRDSRPVPVRAITQTVKDENRVRYVIRVLMPLNPIEEGLARIRRFLVFLVIVTLLVTSWAGILLVRVTLQPVDRMVSKIRRIRSDNLGERLYIKDTNDEINRLAHTFNEMLERLEKSFEAQKQIVQDLSHELKTPLTILRGQLEVALRRPRPPQEYASLLESSVAEIENIRRIIDDLLMLARLDSRSGVLDMKKTELKPLLEGLLEDVRVLAETKNITVAFEAADNCTIQANSIHLKRLFMNLLDNAVKYTPAGGSIRVGLRAGSNRVKISVSDSGPGISAAHLPHVFDRFYRGEKSQSGDGYGLGLSIAKSIVDTHKGKIEVESQPGAGTTFHVFLHKQMPMRLFQGFLPNN